MAASRRRSGYKAASTSSCRRHPEIQHPPDDYSLIEADLHRATTSLEVRTAVSMQGGHSQSAMPCRVMPACCVRGHLNVLSCGGGYDISSNICKSVRTAVQHYLSLGVCGELSCVMCNTQMKYHRGGRPALSRSYRYSSRLLYVGTSTRAVLYNTPVHERGGSASCVSRGGGVKCG